MAKDYTASVTNTEVQSDAASDYPIRKYHETHTVPSEVLVEWPAEPHALALEPAKARWTLAYDVALCVVPLALIAKAVLCIVASVIDKGHTGYEVDMVSNLTRYLIRFNQQLTTLFTVVFILIITTGVKRLALYLAQEGATISKLEQLQASTSLTGTVQVIWSLRTFGRTSAALLLLWSWYYLGSQATTEEYKYRTSNTARKMDIAYFSPQKQSLFYSNHSTVDLPEVTISNINSIFNIFSTVSSSHTSQAGYDLNGAVLVPLVNANGSLGNPWSVGDLKSLKQERHGWYDVSKNSDITYTSYFGTSIYMAVTEYYYPPVYFNVVEGKYTANSTYLNVTCAETQLKDASAFPKGTLSNTQFSINATVDVALHSPEAKDPPQFDVWARLNTTSRVAHASCYVQAIQVEMQVACSANTCQAKKMRFVAPPIDRTVFDNRNFTTVFFNNLLVANGPPFEHYSSDDDNIIGSLIAQNIDLGMTFGVQNMAFPGSNILPQVKVNDDPSLSALMTQMINTYYQTSLDPTQGSNNDDNYWKSNMLGIINGSIPSTDWSRSTLDGNFYSPRYVLSIPWVVVDLISCLILLAAAFYGFWLRRKTMAPDIFGYVSSLTRDNPHLNLPDGGSTMDGLERARMLKNVRVRIGDVADGSGVGKVGLRYAGPSESDVQMAHLERGRHYA